MLQTKMKVAFYGHVRQYHNIKKEIDANIHEVLEIGQYVIGPMLQRFEKELAEFHKTKYAIGVGNGTDARTNCIDPAKSEAAITPRTKAIVAVHLYGQCADMKAIRKIADKHKLLV